jgi:sulfotransferase family protein
MKVIGAGLMRTGTMTMQAALERLGYHCYHMRRVPRERGHLDAWHKFVTGQALMDWRALFHKFDATVDTPACLYYRELMEVFPDAKVVLTVRDPDRWYESFTTLYRIHNSARPAARVIPKLGKFVRFVDVILANMFGGALDRDNCIRVFTEHNEAVQRFVPPERLLVFRVTEGWEPLCKFLGCAVPEGVPFPHLNEGDQTLRTEAWQIFVGPWVRNIALTAVGLAVLAWWLQ